MADMQLATLDGLSLTGRSAVTPSRAGEGCTNMQWMGKDGAAVSFPWKQALVLEGRCYHVQVGALITAVACGSGTVPELAEPELDTSQVQLGQERAVVFGIKVGGLRERRFGGLEVPQSHVLYPEFEVCPRV